MQFYSSTFDDKAADLEKNVIQTRVGDTSKILFEDGKRSRSSHKRSYPLMRVKLANFILMETRERLRRCNVVPDYI